MTGQGRALRLLLVLAALMMLSGPPACPTVAASPGAPATVAAVTDDAHPLDPGGRGHGCHHLTPDPPAVVGAVGRPIECSTPAVLPLTTPANRGIPGLAAGQPVVDSPRPPGRDLLIAHGIART